MKLPILILVYNRIEITLKLIDAILLYQPKLIYISSDGPKNKNDIVIINKLRKKIEEKIRSNNCKIIKLYSYRNLGLKKKVHKSIDYFFSKESKGIILEDDCIPNLSFFNFCELILHKYENNHKISMISGTNLIGKKKDLNRLSYFYSQYFNIWGWATWADRWQRKKVDMKNLKKLNIAHEDYLNKEYIKWVRKAHNIHKTKDTSWAMSWFIDCLYKNTFTIVPEVNLIKNIGLEGSHTIKFDTKNLYHKTYSFKNLIFRKKLNYDFEFDNQIYKSAIHRNVFSKIFYKLIKILT